MSRSSLHCPSRRPPASSSSRLRAVSSVTCSRQRCRQQAARAQAQSSVRTAALLCRSAACGKPVRHLLLQEGALLLPHGGPGRRGAVGRRVGGRRRRGQEGRGGAPYRSVVLWLAPRAHGHGGRRGGGRGRGAGAGGRHVDNDVGRDGRHGEGRLGLLARLRLQVADARLEAVEVLRAREREGERRPEKGSWTRAVQVDTSVDAAARFLWAHLFEALLAALDGLERALQRVALALERGGRHLGVAQALLEVAVARLGVPRALLQVEDLGVRVAQPLLQFAHAQLGVVQLALEVCVCAAR